MSLKLRHFLIGERWSKQKGVITLAPQPPTRPTQEDTTVTSLGWTAGVQERDREQSMELMRYVDNIGKKVCSVLQNERYLRGLRNKDHIYHLKAKLITAMKLCTLINVYRAPVLMAHFQNRQC